MTTRTEEIIYKMLTESTGVAMMDSGGDNNRHWQQNQLRTLEDFKKDDLVTVDRSYDYPEITLNIFPFLNECLEYNGNETRDLNAHLLECNRYNEADSVMSYFNNELFKDDYAQQLNSYNDDCLLSQTIQVIYSGDLYDNDLMAISIHNGADVRGGYTDFKLFNVDVDGLFNYSPYSWDHLLEEKEEA
tara:strand:- start:25 stop:588 length:564 start_codon:yes stop_codon:yes gene_type:complete